MKTTVQKLQAAYDLAGRRKELTLYDSENNPTGTFQKEKHLLSTMVWKKLTKMILKVFLIWHIKEIWL